MLQFFSLISDGLGGVRPKESGRKTTCGLSILVLKCWSWFGCVRLHTYYLPWLSVMNISRHVYVLQANPKPNPLSITYGTQAFLSSLHYYFYAWDASIQGTSISTQLCSSTLACKFNFQLLSFKIMILMNWMNEFKNFIIVLVFIFKHHTEKGHFRNFSLTQTKMFNI